MARKHQVFISYSSKDREVADALFNELESTGISCWMAPGSIAVGSDYADAITQAIKNSEAFILVFSANSNASEHCQAEVSLAHDNGIRLVPFRIDDIEASPSLQYFLAKRHWLDASSGPLSTHTHALHEQLSRIFTDGEESSSASAETEPSSQTPDKIQGSRRGKTPPTSHKSPAPQDDATAILVVDDNEDNRYTLVHRLEREGYGNITEAENGRQALEVLMERPFDLVLLDIMMPEMNGYQLLEHMKADTSLRDIPVVMISASEEIESVVRCIELGAEDYLMKPFNKVLLKARVSACIEKKRLGDQERKYLHRLEDEKHDSDELLHAILPSGAIRELKSINEVKPRRYDDVVVLYCNIVNFASYCDGSHPEQAVGELQTVVAEFEDIVQRHGLEKIKTTGGAFLATGGLLGNIAEPVLASVKCGLDMLAACERAKPEWDARVGIHSGPVVAGIVGHRQFLFDVWGETVNTAMSISERADQGTVLLTGPSWQHVRGRCRGKSHGFMTLEGIGSLELVECEEVR
jgi:CheY-like chemotaxis protein